MTNSPLLAEELEHVSGNRPTDNPYVTTQDLGSFRDLQNFIQMTEEERNIEATGLRSELT